MWDAPKPRLEVHKLAFDVHGGHHSLRLRAAEKHRGDLGTRTLLRSNIRNRVLGGKGGAGKIGEATMLSSTLMGDERWGATTLCFDPCRDEQEKRATAMTCYVHLKHNENFVQIQEQLNHWWQ